MRSAKFAFAFLLLTPIAWANSDNVCPKPQDFKNRIYNCGENRLAEQLAKSCAKDSLSVVRSSGVALNNAMKDLEKQIASHQQNATLDALSRLDLALDSLAAQIPFLQKRTSLIASYVSVMIDYPDAADDEESMDCFSEHFHEMQKVVKELDAEIIAMKKTYKKAEMMAMEVSKRHADYSSLVQDTIPKAPTPKSSPAPKGKNIRASDISGTEEQEKP
jgi:hypothetical protein